MIFPILFLGLILRTISLNQSLWLDEAISALAVKNYSLTGVLTQYIRGDFHPPGYFFLLWIWSRLFGYSEIALRAPSVILGVATIFVVYLFAKKLFSKRVGILAALLLAVNPLHIYYSQEVRMYALAAFAVSLSLLFLVELIQKEKYALLGLTISFILILGSDYLAYLAIVSEFLILTVLKKFQIFKSCLKAFGLAVLVWVWFLPIGFSQLQGGENLTKVVPGWASVVGSTGIKPLALTYVKFIFGRISLSDKFLYQLVFLPIGLVFGWLIFTAIKKIDHDKRIILVSFLIAPILLGLVISFFVPVYDYFRVLFTLPVFIILVAIGLSILKGNLYKTGLLFIVTIELGCSLIYLFNPVFHREDWRGLISFISRESGDRLVLLESSGDFAPITYYTNSKIHTLPALRNFPANESSDLIDLGQTLQNKSSVLLLNYLVDISDRNRLIARKLSDLGFRQRRIYNFNSVGFLYEYDR